ncbi:amidophosphoribosyltransferase [Haloglycomyces albus]|uniref:amidophosphoribosyltransferase n=1 Tax=Haloglycomyces albus TaxID=526067 RepID=UPI00046D4904|nr:amidophosphoribosyltransferase [Haloglycomyces albus]
MARGDGRLTTDLEPDNPGPRDACGIVGIWAPGEEVAKLTYFGLYALQHRGQEAAGIAVADGDRTVVYKDVGLVAQVFDEKTLAPLQGYVSIGHARYSTTGSSTWENAQPTIRANSNGVSISLAHNGNLVNTADLAATAKANGLPPGSMTSDTGVLTALLTGHESNDLAEAACEVLPQVKGAYSLVFNDNDTLYATRDPQGFRPLMLGKLDNGWMVASETAALDTVGARFEREIEPGEIVSINENGVKSTHFTAPQPKQCLFEWAYLARPDSRIDGQTMYQSRINVGRTLAREHPADADMVIGVPESGIPAAIGYATESKIPYGLGFTKNTYVGRTFIQPSESLRKLGVRLKLNPLSDQIRGKRLVVVDDTIVRGTTQRALVKMLRDAGALEVHVRISAPPIKWPCFMGIDFATREELIANAYDLDGIRDQIGADSLGYVSLDGLTAASEQKADNLCRACFDGQYPVELPDNLGKNLLEIAST